MARVPHEKIKWPFEGINRIDANQVEEKMNDWWWFKVYCDKNGSEEKYKKQRLSHYSSRIWNYTSFEKVLALAKFFTFFYLFDDQNEVEATEDACDKLIARISSASQESKEVAAGSDWLLAGINDVWECVTKLECPKEWKHKQLHAVISYLKAIKSEAKFRIDNVVPSSVEYLTLRPGSVCADISFNFIEYSYGQYLTVETIADPLFQGLLHHCRCIILATNDLYSHYKEEREGDMMNLVTVWQNEFNLSTEESFEKVFGYIKENLKYYLMYRERVKVNVKQDIQFFTHGLEQYISGTQDFLFESGRYE